MIRFQLAILLLLSVNLQARQAEPFDTTLINAKSKLIGWTRIENTRDKVSFILDQPEDIKKVMPLLTSGPEVNLRLTHEPYYISLVQNNREIRVWKVNIPGNRIMSNNNCYWFDASIISKLAKENPFRFKSEKKIFITNGDAQEFLRKESLNRNFLFARIPSGLYEGIFDIPVPRNVQYKHPDTIANYLRTQIERIVPQGAYDFYDFQRSRDPQSKIQYIITICGSRELFDKLDAGDLTKENWKSLTEPSYFYYRKY
ncbi:hypothetical protein [Paraflavitalea sp. CAU 1676]|uniref:hypothetical protein n=1 Tax=Paraflavitalea sp. CAU 1676 TaxID=3032598 RepID=UPI0023D98425|nr:hypothetical protein [Paraflavitalea sp. CAU 1676]MDF2189031.1 hypothetical protein [Paraflavitalea sp. CAU 1676]